jgi:hypothetical protein
MKFVLRISLCEDNYVNLIELSSKYKVNLSDLLSVSVFCFDKEIDKIIDFNSKNKVKMSFSVSLSCLNKLNSIFNKRDDLSRSAVVNFILKDFFKNKLEDCKQLIEFVSFSKF